MICGCPLTFEGKSGDRWRELLAYGYVAICAQDDLRPPEVDHVTTNSRGLD